MRRLRVGITVSSAIEDPAAALWSSGVHQNAVFLCMLLGHLPAVAWAGLVAAPGDSPSALAKPFDLPSCGLSEALGEADVLIELGVRADKALMAAFRARGGKLVSYMAGNAMAMNFEALANKAAHGEILDHAGFAAAWITPQHWKMNRAYAALTRSESVRMAPHVWHPGVVELLARHFSVAYGWRPPAPADGWRIGIFEPNVNVLKTFHLPLLVCEQAYRRSPSSIARVLMFGSIQLKDNVHFKELCGVLDLAQAGKLFAEARHPLVQALGTHVDAVVTHQWENALNYLYWDVLHGGFPLVHNAPDIAEAGYYYPAFDPKKGGEVLVAALAEHASTIDDYRRRAGQAIARYHIDNEAVRAAYAALLDELSG